jgi:vacuolar-type H+-ATPase subunit I/STV1
MTEQQDLPSDEPQEDEVSEEAQDQAREAEGEGYAEPDADDSPELRLQALSAEYARERAALAEQVSQLQEENDRLTRRVKALEQVAEAEQAKAAALPADDRHPEWALGLDFSLPEEQGKG